MFNEGCPAYVGRSKCFAGVLVFPTDSELGDGSAARRPGIKYTSGWVIYLAEKFTQAFCPPTLKCKCEIWRQFSTPVAYEVL